MFRLLYLVGHTADFIKVTLQPTLCTAAVVSLNEHDQGIVEIPALPEFVEDPADLLILKRQRGGEHFHETRCYLFLLRAQRVPAYKRLGARCQNGIRWNHAPRFLPGECFLTHDIPALIKTPLEFFDPFLRNLVRCVRRTGRVPDHPGLVRGRGGLVPQPADCIVGKFTVEDEIRLISESFDPLNTPEHARPVLVGVSSDKTVKILETQAGGPQVKRSGRTAVLVRNIVVLAKECGVVAVSGQNPANRRGTARYRAGVSRVAGGQVRDHSTSGHMGIATGQHRRPGGRAHGGRVETVIQQTTRRQGIQSGGGYRSSQG